MIRINLDNRVNFQKKFVIIIKDYIYMYIVFDVCCGFESCKWNWLF